MPRDSGTAKGTRGGPKTAAGKAVSRKNALRHGLTARELLPESLTAGSLAAAHADFMREFQPQTPSEQVLVAELARHGLMLGFAAEAEHSVLRHGATELTSLVCASPQDPEDQRDAVLSAAVATDTLDRFVRYRRGHEKAFLAALNKLRELRNARQGTLAVDPSQPAVESWTEEQCENLLKARFENPDWRCPHCRQSPGRWLARRRCWQCSTCRRQIGVRHGTVMARSPLPLTVWFRAIAILARRPDATAAEVTRATGIDRPRTIELLIGRIRQALTSPNKDMLVPEMIVTGARC